MTLASRVLERFRKRLTRFVEKERALTGCATTAIKRVASKLKMSQATIYRAMNGYGQVQIKAHQHVALLMLTMLPRRSRKSRAEVPADFSSLKNGTGQAPVYATLEN